MEDHSQLRELSDEELSLVAGGRQRHGKRSYQNVQQNNVLTNQYTTAVAGLVATAFSVNTVIPINITINA